MQHISTLSKITIACIILAISDVQNTLAQTGYIYIHEKSISQDLNQGFTFSVSGGTTTVPNFTLEDQAINIEPTDIGAGHGTGGGELWAVTGATNGVNGAIYHRAPSSSTWSMVSGQTASSIDGADLGHFVIVNTSGDAYVYNGLGFIKIFNHTSMGSNAVDIANNGSIASGTGITAVVDNNGKVWKYTGNYLTTTTWSNITPTDNSGNTFKRVDINPTTNDIILIDGGGYVTKINAAGTGLVYYSRGSSSTWLVMDVAGDNFGNVYAIGNNTANGDVVFRYNGTTWTAEPQMQEHYFLTCGDAGQAWCAKGYPAAQYTWMSNASSIFTRTDDGTASWMDDERIVTTQNGNAILIPVAPGTYSITESNVANWNLQNITIYDSTTGSTSNVSANNAKIVVKAGQVANLLFINGLVAPLTIPQTCGVNNIIQNFGSGTAGTNGAPISGLTDYHYFGSANLKANDGYYSISQNTSVWTNTILKDHSGVTNGYFLVINASYAANEFYKQRVTGLVPRSSYTLTFWAANLSPTSPLQPNILAGITDTASGIILGSISTGNLPQDSAWHMYSFTFTATVTSGDLFLQNNAAGGDGNDLAIDDIGFNMTCTTLPVTLTSFTAEKENTSSLLKWNTTKQVNFSHFEVERSPNGNAWTSIATIAGKDGYSLTESYTYTDELPLNGINYYRLKMVDMNGTTIFSEVKTLDFSSNEWIITMYPNPATTGGVVKVQSNQPLQMIRVFDINGKLVMAENIASTETHGNSSYSLNTNNLPAGMYLVQAANSNGKMNSLKLMKRN